MSKALTLPEAIRIGAAKSKQHFGGAFSEDGRASCALGAAFLGASIAGPLDITFPELKATAPCPACTNKDGPMVSIIAHLNDDHCWSREAIADWLEADRNISVQTEEILSQNTNQHPYETHEQKRRIPHEAS